MLFGLDSEKGQQIGLPSVWLTIGVGLVIYHQGWAPSDMVAGAFILVGLVAGAHMVARDIAKLARAQGFRGK